MNTDFTDKVAFREKVTVQLLSLCVLCVLCVSVVVLLGDLANHRDTENTEDAQRRNSATAFVQQQVDKELDERLLYLLSQRQTPSVEVVQQLLDKGARVNQPVRYKTALMHAASGGHIEIVKLLL